jgi:large subunit ribosomal protein L15
MPLQKRLPKYGFTSRIGRKTASIRLGELNKVAGDTADLDALRKAGLINTNITRARVFLAGELSRAVTVKGLRVTKGARAAIEAAGGAVEE